MIGAQEDALYYLTVGNELYEQPAMPVGAEQGILRGAYVFRKGGLQGMDRVQLFGSGAILNEALRAQEFLADRFSIASDVWSVTSYKLLHQDCLDTERWNRLHPKESERESYITKAMRDATNDRTDNIVVAASDYLKILPDSISRWIPGTLVSLGTDGFGRSDGRKDLRNFFEVNSSNIAVSALHELKRRGRVSSDDVLRALKELKIDPEKSNPRIS